MSETLIELIYESAFLPELWSKVLDQLAAIADARGGALYFPGRDGLRWKAWCNRQAEVVALLIRLTLSADSA